MGWDKMGDTVLGDLLNIILPCSSQICFAVLRDCPSDLFEERGRARSLAPTLAGRGRGHLRGEDRRGLRGAAGVQLGFVDRRQVETS